MILDLETIPNEEMFTRILNRHFKVTPLLYKFNILSR